jgi:hypothetical protein
MGIDAFALNIGTDPYTDAQLVRLNNILKSNPGMRLK